MKKLLAAVLGILLLGSCAVKFVGQEFPEVVKVVTPFGHGSGVVVEQGVLTAEHVVSFLVQGGREYKIETANGTFEGNTYSLRGGRGRIDWAILNVETGIKPARVYCGPLQLGEPVVHVGYPQISGTVSKYITWGRVNSVDTGGEGAYANMVGLDIGADAGSSGGPVYNRRGEVIGTVIAVGRGHYGSMWTTLMARPPAEVCPPKPDPLPVISNEVP